MADLICDVKIAIHVPI